MTNTTEPRTFQVAVVGPNLPSQAKATFHVHAAGCADLQRGWIARYVDGFTFHVSCAHDVEAVIYDFAPDETPGYKLGDFLDEFHFAPCLADLPTTIEPVEPEVVETEPARLLAKLPIVDTWDGDYDIVVTDEPAKPTMTNERTYIVRGRDGELLDEQPTYTKAMASGLDLAGYLADVATEWVRRGRNAHRGAEIL